MSRGLESSTLTELQKPRVNYIVLVEAEWTNGNFVRIWNGYEDFSYQENLFKGTGEFFKFAPPSEQTDTSTSGAEAYFYVENDEIKAALNADLDEPYQGGAVKAWIFLVNNNNQIVGGPIYKFSGILDTDDINDDGTGIEVVLKAEARIADPTRKKNYRYNQSSQRALNPGVNDRFFEFVETQQGKELIW